jgi:hypothetical protein
MIMKWLTILFVVMGLLMILGMPRPCEAVNVYYVEKPVELYGNLDQDDIPGGGEIDCGPVAAVNSFVYLENKYPWAYDRHLVPDTEFPPDGIRDYDELINAAILVSGANNMNTKPTIPGTWDDMFIYGKMQYIEFNVPGVTVYAAQMLGMWAWPGPPLSPRPPDEVPPIPKPIWVQDWTYPTWQFIFGELHDCEDVEILLSWNGGGHYLTLTGFNWTDTDGDGVIDAEEEAMMMYIDPQTGAPGATGIWNVPVDSEYEIMTNYETGSVITMAVSESPIIPEPAAIMMVGLALAGLVGTIRRRM